MSELEKQAELVKRLEAAYKESEEIVAAKEQEIASLIAKGETSAQELTQYKSNMSSSQAEASELNE